MASDDTDGPVPDDLRITVQQEGDETLVTVRLAYPADHCFARFCQVDDVPTWLWVVGGAVVHKRDEQGRALEVDFMGHLQRASVGYALSYRYDDAKREVTWHNRRSSGAVKAMSGSAHFIPEEDGACTLRYSLRSELSGTLPDWDDRLYRSRPAEAVVLDFCEWLDKPAGDAEERAEDGLEDTVEM